MWAGLLFSYSQSSMTALLVVMLALAVVTGDRRGGGIGLLPRFARARYLQVGNAAGAGARAALLSVTERDRVRRIADRVASNRRAKSSSVCARERYICHPYGFTKTPWWNSSA